ncbi:MAG: hypothetical protein HY298_13940 [Verrucomicrobia bacterium]|nr:hypothetical protein [Verrucomicrobiota bacterium]
MKSRNRLFALASALRMHWLSLLALAVLESCTVCATTAAEFPAADWERVTEHTQFSPRDTAEGVVFGGKMWLSNGYLNGGILVRDLWSSIDGITWKLITTNAPYDGYAEMTVYAGKIWAVKQSVRNSADGVNWKQIAEKTPFGVRSYGELVVHDGMMWQLGSGEDVWSTTNGVTWKCLAAHAPYGSRFASAAVAFKGKLWVIGGAVEKTNTPREMVYPEFTTFNDVWCSSDGADWTRVVEHAPWLPRMWFVPIVYADRLWIIGGFDNVHRANFDDAWWTEDGIKWHRLDTKTKFSPRHEVTAYVHANSLWVVAGNSWPLMNDVWKLTPTLIRRK